MTQIYNVLRKSIPKEAEECARAIVLLAIVQEWSRQKKFIENCIKLFSIEWYQRSSWAMEKLGIKGLEKLC